MSSNSPDKPPTLPILPFQGLRFEVVPSRFKETLPKASFPTPPAYAVETAKQKALEVARRMHQARPPAPRLPAASLAPSLAGFQHPCPKETRF